MSINLKDYFISQHLPESLNDRNVKELAELSDVFLHRINALIGKLLIYPNVNNLDEELINYLGYQQHIENFSKNLSLDSKKELIKNSFLIHRYKGTPWAVETALSLMLAPTDILEWFEYNGKPYRFRPLINMSDARVVLDRERKKELIKIINATKNVRSWLDGILLKLNIEDTIAKTNEETKLLLNLDYEDMIPYGGINHQAYSEQLIYPFEYQPERNLNIDKINLQLELNIEDRYETLIEYGLFDYGHNAVYGGFTVLPIDAALDLTLEISVEDDIPKIDDGGGDLTIFHTWHYGDDTVYGAFEYGEQLLTDSLNGNLRLTKEGAKDIWQQLSA